VLVLDEWGGGWDLTGRSPGHAHLHSHSGEPVGEGEGEVSVVSDPNPDGSAPVERTNTAVFDPVDEDLPVQWGQKVQARVRVSPYLSEAKSDGDLHTEIVDDLKHIGATVSLSAMVVASTVAAVSDGLLALDGVDVREDAMEELQFVPTNDAAAATAISLELLVDDDGESGLGSGVINKQRHRDSQRKPKRTKISLIMYGIPDTAGDAARTSESGTSDGELDSLANRKIFRDLLIRMSNNSGSHRDGTPSTSPKRPTSEETAPVSPMRPHEPMIHSQGQQSHRAQREYILRAR
jgi:hypothetical protein